MYRLGFTMPATIKQSLTSKATQGLLKFQLSYFEKYQDTIGKWESINMILDACNDDEIANMIKEYHKNRKEE